jgi:glycosyltransferase involved in cell wall biosynthesis
MRILWFTNTLMPDACKALGQTGARGSGWWMSALLERLKLRSDLSLAVVTVTGFKDAHLTVDGVDYFVIRQSLRGAVLGRLRHPWAGRPSAAQIGHYAEIVKQWNPDVVHVHGTERDYGLVKAFGLIDTPVVVSIQGLLGPYSREAFGDLLPRELTGSLKRRLTGFNSDSLYRWKVFRQHAPIEEQILLSADIVLGRTEWDFAWAWAINPGVKYRHVDELMRPEFWQAEPWSVETCHRHQVVCTTGSVALKGLHVLLEAIWRLRRTYPDISLKVAASGFVPQPTNDYADFVTGLVKRWGLRDIVHFLGWLDAHELVGQLRAAHCYVTPSFIENSSNALQEAMLLGVPVVATASGGTPTIVEDGHTGFTFPPGDGAFLALQIHKLFQNDGLAARLGNQAVAVAHDRHDPGRVEKQLMSAYGDAMATVTDHEITHARA